MIKSELHQFLLSHRDYCKEKVFEKYFPEYYIEISKLVFPDDFKFSQKLYHYFNNDINLKLGYCLVCGNKCKFLSFVNGYSKHCCMKCSNKNPELKIKRANGYKEYYKNENEENKLKRFQQQSETLHKTISLKSDETKKEEYRRRGESIHNSWINKPDYIKKEEIQKRSKLIKQTWDNKSETEKYIIIQKRKDAQLNKFNGKWAAQTYEFAKNRKHGIKFNNIYFDSKWEIDVYCYCIDNNFNFEYHPNISFEYKYDNHIYHYQPDFIINGKLYEVKGGHFFENNKMICPFNRNTYTDGKFEAKHQCMINNNVIILYANKTRNEFLDNIKKVIK